MTPFLILGVCIFVMYYLDHIHSHMFLSGVFILAICACIYVYISSKDLFQFIRKDPKQKDSPHYTMVSNDQVKKVPQDYLSHMKTFLKRLKPYRKYNKVSYDSGKYHLRQFLMYIVELQEKPEHPRHTYENAESTYRTALNEFQSLSLAIPSHTKLHQLSDSTSIIDHAHKIGTICKELRTYCHQLLHSFSGDINKDTYESPNIYKSEIVQHDIVGYNLLHPNELY